MERKKKKYTIIDHRVEVSDELELEDLDTEEDTANAAELPLTRLTHETVTNAITSGDILFGNHTLKSLSNLTISELLDLNTVNDNENARPGNIIFNK